MAVLKNGIEAAGASSSSSSEKKTPQQRPPVSLDDPAWGVVEVRGLRKSTELNGAVGLVLHTNGDPLPVRLLKGRRRQDDRVCGRTVRVARANLRWWWVPSTTAAAAAGEGAPCWDDDNDDETVKKTAGGRVLRPVATWRDALPRAPVESAGCCACGDAVDEAEPRTQSRAELCPACGTYACFECVAVLSESANQGGPRAAAA
eukprot:CAMPEP_0185708212 /NCGR_PEP_ID=MMETSP1164-20130828/26071_1 /TAXON_ID=1104430 /ORGANISM="Chrysoreinhardia sp, Strain CCMP2950" /LENGTH=202 /DNA_ID=CAMNT_0028375655 /DNA_START=8 /DNA_END=613 /DNA_ORIENTATION=+